MTSLFNLFCPMILSGHVVFSVIFMVIFILLLGNFILVNLNIDFMKFLFDSNLILIFGMLMLMWLNLTSLICYSYPVTTTFSFNFSMAFSFWSSSLLLLMLKPNTMSSVLPSNSPWYLVSFLSVVELISLFVRSITLSFRLLANMSAGHILLSLISKMGFGLWMLGSVFGILELMVCMVQAFVFFMLISVYLEEGLSH